MRRLLLAMHPRRWRARYGEEFAALLDDTGLSVAVILDVLHHAIGLQLRARPLLVRVAAAVCTTAAIEIIAVRTGLTDNILWAPSTALRALALVAALTPGALLASPVVRRRVLDRGRGTP
ncbi:hypothetical protein [Frankia sp. Cr2]|uniref:hypothetical protein n=1 Tax=Frankia sp. Cr2 TaxID=3073932 RepID=UPI002AD2859B|nr:hypothetical protein [Frankia sp. Cr2]